MFLEDWILKQAFSIRKSDVLNPVFLLNRVSIKYLLLRKGKKGEKITWGQCLVWSWEENWVSRRKWAPHQLPGDAPSRPQGPAGQADSSRDGDMSGHKARVSGTSPAPSHPLLPQPSTAPGEHVPVSVLSSGCRNASWKTGSVARSKNHVVLERTPETRTRAASRQDTWGPSDGSRGRRQEQTAGLYLSSPTPFPRVGLLQCF